MCGIVGTVHRDPATPYPAAARCAAVTALRHRGPDGQGQYQHGQVWLGHLRLSIIDLSEAASQPMATADGRFVVSYNGEVYNFRELASELALDGLRSHSDTEVMLRAVERLGVESFRRLNGMFAFAVYDRERQKVWLVRDRLGIKPLYYRFDADGLVFGSEIKAITALGSSASVCDVSTLHEWLYYGNALGGRTLYQGIHQLRPGHYLELDIASFHHRIAPYWSLQEQTAGEAPAVPPGGTIAETRRLLEAAVRRQLVSDVPVGVFLSGGVDSTAITAFASKHYDGKLATYSAGFDDQRGVDERPKARRIAAQYGTDHHEVHIGGGEVADLVEKMVHHHDLPFADAANIPLYLMASQISGRTKVILQGDGGDEVFGGYRRYVSLRHYRALHVAAILRRPLRALQSTSPLSDRVHRYLSAFAAPDVGTTMALLLTVEGEHSDPVALFSPHLQDTIKRSDPFARYREVQRSVAGQDIGNQMSLVDLMIELPDIFLEKVDRATMAASLEVRVPFLDHDLVDYVARIPGRLKMPWGKKKWLLKQALAGIVPDSVLYGPKTGFSVPFGYWLRTALQPLFLDHLATFEREQPGVVDAALVRSRYAHTQAGVHDYSNSLWKLLNLLVWCNNSKVGIPR